MSRPALVPEFYVSDLSTSIAFYVDTLGFRVVYERSEQRFAALGLGGAHLMLEEAPVLERASRKDFQRGQWRTADPDGYLLRFSQVVSPDLGSE